MGRVIQPHARTGAGIRKVVAKDRGAIIVMQLGHARLR